MKKIEPNQFEAPQGWTESLAVGDLVIEIRRNSWTGVPISVRTLAVTRLTKTLVSFRNPLSGGAGEGILIQRGPTAKKYGNPYDNEGRVKGSYPDRDLRFYPMTAHNIHAMTLARQQKSEAEERVTTIARIERCMKNPHEITLHQLRQINAILTESESPTDEDEG